MARTTRLSRDESEAATAGFRRSSAWVTGNVFCRREVGPFPATAAILLFLATAATFLAGCRSTPPPTPLDQLNPQQAQGHDVFLAHCAACHYDRQSGPLHGPSLLGVFKKPALPSGAAATDERVTATILHGRNQMPAMASQIDDNDLNDLLAYLHTL